MPLVARVLRSRALVRAPIPLFRVGLGWVFGRRLLLLEHVGRASGLPRYAVLEVVDRPTPESIHVAAGWGERTQWLRNLRAEPTCHVTLGRQRRRPATARVLTADQRDAVLARYRRVHPRAWAMLARGIAEVSGGPARDIPVVELVLS